MNSEVTPFAFGLCHRRRNLLSLQPPMSLCVCHTKAKFCAAQREIKALGHSQQNKRVKPKESKRQRKGLRDKDQPQIWYFIHIRSGAEVQFKVHKTKIQKRSAPRFCCSLSLQVCSDIPIFQATKVSPVLCKTIELISSPAPGYAPTQICISGISNILTQPQTKCLQLHLTNKVWSPGVTSQTRNSLLCSEKGTSPLTEAPPRHPGETSGGFIKDQGKKRRREKNLCTSGFLRPGTYYIYIYNCLGLQQSAAWEWLGGRSPFIRNLGVREWWLGRSVGVCR